MESRVNGTYVIADGDRASIAIPIRVSDDEWECLELSGIFPSTFRGYFWGFR